MFSGAQSRNALPKLKFQPLLFPFYGKACVQTAQVHVQMQNKQQAINMTKINDIDIKMNFDTLGNSGNGNSTTYHRGLTLNHN